MHFEVRRARALFAEGYRLLPMLDRRSGACVAAMAGIYRRLLDRIERDPEAVLRGRVSLPGREKAYVAVRGLSGLDARTIVPTDRQEAYVRGIRGECGERRATSGQRGGQPSARARRPSLQRPRGKEHDETTTRERPRQAGRP